MQCVECGMLCAEYLPEDRRDHRKYHDAVVNGALSREFKSDVVIWADGPVHRRGS
jgi:hypothetical protein